MDDLVFAAACAAAKTVPMPPSPVIEFTPDFPTDSPLFDSVPGPITDFTADLVPTKTIPTGAVVPDTAWLVNGKKTYAGKTTAAVKPETDAEALKRLRSNEAARKRKKRPLIKPGSSQIYTEMARLQRSYNIQKAGIGAHPGSPGQEGRMFLKRILKNFMAILNEESEHEGYQWRDVPCRPNANPIVFSI